MTGAAGDFLVDLADRLSLGSDPEPIRTMLERACGGQLDPLGPDGHRASMLTVSGIPFEASVSGGRGKVTPAVRYITETATQETQFDLRLAAQLAAIRELVAWLPNGDEAAADMLQSFVTTLYPDPSEVSTRHRSATWIGVVHHAAAPHHAARLKVYGGLKIVPGALQRLCSAWPGFAGLATVPENEKLITPVAAAIEVDARGDVNHKIYLKARYDDVAVPMKLSRYFGHPAWELLSEFVRCGIDAAQLHRHDWFVCCSRGAGGTGFGLSLGSRQHTDFSGLVRELASAHYGSPYAVDALAEAAEACGAAWRYSAVGLGFSAGHGIDKLNVYGTPTWGTAS
ncbi:MULTISPECIES: hypothetical protein [Nocardia]|uniref:hypothetical protein n=1 Tax=Nocardia abscessus TaxID=120957 RepID=UPI0018955337|nr:hypothetical protein [Nocardia abscessus]MBF6471651.1 hypothetical protein [Nocardia abscessus]